jgi:hypothetical protein
MSLSDIFKGDLATGLLIGIGVAILTPVVLAVLTSVAKPVAAGAVKGGASLYEKGKEAVAGVGEIFGDIVAEAKAELSEERQTAEGGVSAKMTEEAEQT